MQLNTHVEFIVGPLSLWFFHICVVCTVEKNRGISGPTQIISFYIMCLKTQRI